MLAKITKFSSIKNRFFKKPSRKKLAIIVALPLFGLGFLLLTPTPRVHAETNPVSIAAYTYQTFYAYVKAGETLDASFTKLLSSPAGTQITITGPGNIVHSANGVIPPGQPCAFVTGTCTWTGLTAATSGLWEIKINNSTPAPIGNNAGDYTWNITVRDNVNTALTGRVYSELVSLRQPASGGGSVSNVQAWYQSRDGYLYKVAQNGYGGVNSVLVGDNVGVRQNSTCLSGYRNLPATGYSTPALFECGEPFKIFVNAPDPTLPAQAPLPDGTLEWLKPTPTPPTVTGTTFTGNSLVKRSGDINYTLSTFTGQYIVDVDTNGDGTYGGPLDRSFLQFSNGGGPNTIPFDGNYANGNPIPVTQNINVRVGIYKGGELHFTGADVEIRVGGIEVQVLNGNTPNAYLNVYWNDSLSAGAATTCAASGGGNFSVNGKPSQGGVHTWGNSNPILDCVGQWGNNKTIDDWTFVPLNAVQTLAVPGLQPRVHYHKTVSPIATSISPGQTFTYSVKVENTGDLPLTGLSFTDNLSDVLDDATYNNDVVSGGIGTASFSSGTISWSGDLAIGASTTIVYSVTINPVPANGILRNNVVGTGAASNCTASPAVDPECFTITPLPDVTAVKSLVGPANPQAGDTVNYQFIITNNGASAATGISVADELTGVLDDAAYVNASAPFGTVTFDTNSGRVIWNGNLAANGSPNDAVTVTVTVKVNDADNMGDGTLNNALISSDCPNPVIFDPLDPGYDANCAVSTPVTAWMARKTISAASSGAPGANLVYTIQVQNTGGVDLVGGNAPTLTDNLSDVLDDATYNNDVSATVGSPVFNSPNLVWTGDLVAGQGATITYSATIKAAGSLGNRNAANAVTGPMNCPASAVTDPNNPAFNADCAVLTSITVPPNPPVPAPDAPSTGVGQALSKGILVIVSTLSLLAIIGFFASTKLAKR